MTVAGQHKIADALAASNIGYNQARRWTHLNKSKLSKGVAAIVRGQDCDCSTSSGTIARLSGYPVDLASTFYTGNIASRFKAAGFDVIKVGTVKTVAALVARLRAGDHLLGPGHIVYVRQPTRWWSAETDERGKASGGKAGWQPGEKVGYRKPYLRSRGWTYILRPRSTTTWKGRIIAYYAAGRAADLKHALAVFTRRASHDGPLYAEFVREWEKLDRGMLLTYGPKPITGIPTKGHAFVILGSTAAKMRRRVDAALPSIKANPASKIIVTGAPLRDGKTEAAWMRDYLIAAGISADRILLEHRANSTIGNARNALPALREHKIDRYTLVSDASHLRRAQTLFLAAQLAIETAENVRLGITPAGWIAYDDYAPAPVKTAKPVTKATRLAIAAEVASLLGLTKPYTSWL